MMAFVYSPLPSRALSLRSGDASASVATIDVVSVAAIDVVSAAGTGEVDVG